MPLRPLRCEREENQATERRNITTDFAIFQESESEDSLSGGFVDESQS